MNKSVLIGTFVNKKKILSFLETLKSEFNVTLKRIHVYEVENNKNELLITFRVDDKEKYLPKLKHSTVLHVKNGCLFSINALNKMINCENIEENKKCAIDWENFRNKIIILTRGELVISNIKKIEDLGTLFFNF